MANAIPDEKWLYNGYSTDNYMDCKNPELKKAKKDLFKTRLQLY